MQRIIFYTFLTVLLSLTLESPSFAEIIKNDFGYWNKANINVPISDRFKFNLDTQYKYQNPHLNNSFVLRPSVGVDLFKGLSFWNGYAYYNYGEGSKVFENRIWQQIQYETEFSKVNLVTRFRLEERFFQNLGNDDVGVRGRYLLRSMFPFSKKKLWFFVLSDEILFNFNNSAYGVANNGYEGNRLFVGLNHKFNNYLSAELGYQLEHYNPGALKFFGLSLDPPQYLNHGVLFNAYLTTPQIFNRNKKPLTIQPPF